MIVLNNSEEIVKKDVLNKLCKDIFCSELKI